MDDDQKEQISRAVYDGLYALLDDPEVSRDEALDSLRAAIYLVNDEWGIETGQRGSPPDPEDSDDPLGRGQGGCAQCHSPYPKEFHDTKTGSWLAITETELVILAGPGMDPRSSPRRYPLQSLQSVKVHSAPGPRGLSTVYATVAGAPVDPAPRFGALSYALDFADALRTATGIPATEQDI